MINKFISITDLQRQMKSVFSSKEPMRVVLSNNAVTGIVFSKETAELLLESGILEQIREELWEINDPETRDLIIKHRNGKTHPVPFDDFAKEYGL